MTNEIILAGFGGQGILFAGKMLAYAGMISEKEITWLPSYGPEMRGGTCNCHVIMSDKAVSSPMVTAPTALIAMNAPSLDKFEDKVCDGGTILVDSSLVFRKSNRDNIKFFSINATEIANELGVKSLANMVMLGAFVKHTGVLSYETMMKAIEANSSGKEELMKMNKECFDRGYNIN